MRASASVSKQDVSALSAEQKKELVAKLEPPYCQKMGVENESLTPLRDEFLQLNDGRPGSKALQDLQKDVAHSMGAELSDALASVQHATGKSGSSGGAAKPSESSPPKSDGDDGTPVASSSPGPSKFRQRRLSISDIDSLNAGSHLPSASATKVELYSAPEIGSAPVAEPPFPRHIVGTYSCHGVEPSRDGSKVCDKINQDRGGVIFPFAGHPRQALFCVFDGHGEFGDVISQTAMHELQARLEVELSNSNDPAKALKKVRASGVTSAARARGAGA